MRVIVTGGAGFLGRHVVQILGELNHDVVVPRVEEYDFRDQRAAGKLFFVFRPDVVINLAAAVGGIGANLSRPGSFFYDNLMMGMNLLDAARRYDVKKFVQMGSACEYPKDVAMPMQEDTVWDGYPERSNSAYGVAKRALLEMGQAYRKQYGMNVIHILSTNLYGPGDNFNLETSHVIPALIRRCLTENVVKVWGSGRATRDFLFVKDAAKAIVQLMHDYDDPAPINIGSGEEIRIRTLASLIGDLTNFEGRFEFDFSKPDGQPRRVLDVARAARFGVTAETSLEDGLRETVEWYKANAQSR